MASTVGLSPRLAAGPPSATSATRRAMTGRGRRRKLTMSPAFRCKDTPHTPAPIAARRRAPQLARRPRRAILPEGLWMRLSWVRELSWCMSAGRFSAARRPDRGERNARQRSWYEGEVGSEAGGNCRRERGRDPGRSAWWGACREQPYGGVEAEPGPARDGVGPARRQRDVGVAGRKRAAQCDRPQLPVAHDEARNVLGALHPPRHI